VTLFSLSAFCLTLLEILFSVNPSAECGRMNVTFAEPEPSEKVRELIERGEGKRIEFKHELKFGPDKMKWVKTIVAFANGDGGSLIIGVDDESGSVV
jgi:hypothetical protein